MNQFFTAKTKYANLIITAIMLLIATGLSYIYFGIAHNSANIALIYILALVSIARLTEGYFWGIYASLVSVVCVNFLFTYPYNELDFSLKSYPVTFIGMLIVSLLTSASTTNMKHQMQIIAEREKLLIEAEKEKMRANLLRAISHDLRTPLTSIIGSSTSYLDNEDLLTKNQKTGLVTNILEDSHWLLNMVENLLSVTRIHDGNAKVNKTYEPVEEVVSEAAIRLRKRIPNASVSVKVPEELILLPMDAVLIEQVLINLMENAVIHSHSELPVSCFVDESENNVVFHVRDYGIGIPEERIHTIFDGTAYTGNTASDGSRGMGIGLSICKTIIIAHKGTIHAKNHSLGTEFYFSLPKEDSEINA